MESEATIDREDLIMTRPFTDRDHSFIYATWLQGLRHSNDFYKLIDADTYYRQYHRVIEAILTNPSTQVSVACLKETPDVILGYSVTNTPNALLHWVHVKKAWRGIGIAKSLISKDIKTVTHVNKLGVSYLQKHPGFVFNPFQIP